MSRGGLLPSQRRATKLRKGDIKMAVRSQSGNVVGLNFKKVTKEEDSNIAGAPGIYVAQLSMSLTPASVGAATCAEQTFTTSANAAIGDLDVGDFVSVTPPAAGNAATPVAARSAGGNLIIVYCNPTAGALTPAAGTYQVHVMRIE